MILLLAIFIKELIIIIIKLYNINFYILLIQNLMIKFLNNLFFISLNINTNYKLL